MWVYYIPGLEGSNSLTYPGKFVIAQDEEQAKAFVIRQLEIPPYEAARMHIFKTQFGPELFGVFAEDSDPQLFPFSIILFR